MKIMNIKKCMVIALIGVLTIFSACELNSSGENSPLENNPEFFLYWYYFQVFPFDDTVCERGNGSSIYINADRFYPVYNDLTQYTTVILGDSSMDFSRQALGFYNSTRTQIAAVMGNNFCDMNVQMKAIRTTEPANIVIASAGGNDLLAKRSNAAIIESGKILIDKVRTRFPAAKIIMVGVHPTLNAYANANKAVTNNGLKSYMNTLSNTCWVDPLSLFGVNEGEAAPADLMLTEFDDIHYNQAVSLGIRDLISGNCNVSL